MASCKSKKKSCKSPKKKSTSCKKSPKKKSTSCKKKKSSSCKKSPSKLKENQFLCLTCKANCRKQIVTVPSDDIYVSAKKTSCKTTPFLRAECCKDGQQLWKIISSSKVEKALCKYGGPSNKKDPIYTEF